MRVGVETDSRRPPGYFVARRVRLPPFRRLSFFAHFRRYRL